MRIFLLFFFLSLVSFQKLNGFCGPYAGASGGGALYFGEQSGTLTSTILNPVLTVVGNLDADLFNLNGEANFYQGLGFALGGFYAGLEGFVRYTPTIFSQKEHNFFSLDSVIAIIDNTLENKIKVGPWHFGVDGRFGFKADPFTLIYGRIGVEWTRFELESDSNFFAQFIPSSAILSISAKDQNKQRHLRWGAGIEKMLSPCLAFRTDYVFTDYGTVSVNVAVTDNTLPVGLSEQNSAKIHLKSHSLLLGLSYYFCEKPVCCELCCQNQNFCGLYAAASVGGGFLNAKSRPKNSFFIIGGGPSDDVLVSSDATHHLTDSDYTGSIYAGFGNQCGYFYASLEAFAQYLKVNRKRITNKNFNNNLFTFETTVKLLPWQYGIQFRPGILLSSSTLLYGTIGTSYTRIEANVNTIRSTNIVISKMAKSKRFNLRAGIGAEYALCTCWHLRADYIYTNYSELKAQERRVVSNVTTNIDEKIAFETHVATIGIARYF